MQSNNETQPLTDTQVPFEDSIEPLVLLWVLRILAPLGGHVLFIRTHGYDQLELAEKLGLLRPSPDDKDEEEFDAATARRALFALYHTIKAQPQPPAPEPLHTNVKRLGEILELTDVEQQILEFITLLHTDNTLDNAADTLGLFSSNRLYSIIAYILNLPTQEVKQALSRGSALYNSELIAVDHNGTYRLRSKIDILSNNLARHLSQECESPYDILRDNIEPAPPASLSLADYPHIAPTLEVALPYLRHALETAQVGVNIYVYGIPGTGKTQLVRTLAQTLNVPLYEVVSSDNDNEPIQANRRMRAYQVAQNIFKNQKTLLVFDETEDIFQDNMGGGAKSTAHSHKAWMNHTLEYNPTPTFWISNNRFIDPAFMRRFDLVIELPNPSERLRERMITQMGGSLLTEKTIQKLAAHPDLTPAVVQRAIDVVKTVETYITDANESVQHLISNTLLGQGHARLLSNDAHALPGYYDPAFLRTDTPLKAIKEGLARYPAGRVCLYGPAGTGKTAFARWLAHELDQPLLVKRGSDLLSKWVGETEQNLAGAFQSAEADNAILLIDEVDSFLQDRGRAQQTWEISAINELLTQMEGFSGILMASTNRLEDLDSAALRRFDLKIKFDFLDSAGVWAMFTAVAGQLNLPLTDIDALKKRLSHVSNLAAGDFAAVARQARFNPITSADILLDKLLQEAHLKSGARQNMGFLGS